MIIWMINSEWFSILKSGDLENIETFFDKKWYIALLITLLLMSIQNMFTLVPLVLIVTINILLYELILGFVWSWLTSVFGSILAFFLYRYWLHSFFTEKINEDLKEKVNANGFFYIFCTRLIPFIPSSLINMAAGASSIRITHYVGATTLGNLVYIFLMSLLVNGLISADIEAYVLLIILAIFIPFIFILIRKKQKANQKSGFSAKDN